MAKPVTPCGTTRNAATIGESPCTFSNTSIQMRKLQANLPSARSNDGNSPAV